MWMDILWTFSVLSFSKHFKKLWRLFSLKMGRKDRLSERTLWTSLQQPCFTFSPHTRPRSISVPAHFVRAVASAQNFLLTNESLSNRSSEYIFLQSQSSVSLRCCQYCSTAMLAISEPCARSLHWTLRFAPGRWNDYFIFLVKRQIYKGQAMQRQLHPWVQTPSFLLPSLLSLCSTKTCIMLSQYYFYLLHYGCIQSWTIFIPLMLSFKNISELV